MAFSSEAPVRMSASSVASFYNRAVNADTIELHRFGTRGTLSPEARRMLQQTFRDTHCVRLAGLLSPDLLAALIPRIETAAFEEIVHAGGPELQITAHPVVAALNFAANDRSFVQIIETITEARLGSFPGRVYRIAPQAGHTDAWDWHNDCLPDRLIGMSINLTPEPYLGGVFQLKHVNDDRILCEMPNTGLGDAIVFRISDRLEHRITAVTGSVPKTAFAGWFTPVEMSRNPFIA
jgi:hypothetical protein